VGRGKSCRRKKGEREGEDSLKFRLQKGQRHEILVEVGQKKKRQNWTAAETKKARAGREKGGKGDHRKKKGKNTHFERGQHLIQIVRRKERKADGLSTKKNVVRETV